MTEKDKAVQAFKEQHDLVSGNPTAINNLKQSEKENLMPGITAWLNDPKNKNNPYYDQVLALYNQKYSGVGVSALDGFFGLFGPTAYDKQHSEWSSKLSAGWQELLAKISEYDTNLPANLALLNKQAGYNTDLAGSPGEQMNMNDESPIEGLSTGDLGSGLENFEKLGSGLLGIIQTAYGLYTQGLSSKGLRLDNEGKSISNEAGTIANEKAGLGVSDSLFDNGKNYALKYLGDNISSLSKDGLDNSVVDLDSFVKGGMAVQSPMIRHIISSVESYINENYDDISDKRRKRAIKQVENYLYGSEFQRDAYNLAKSRQTSFKDMVKSYAGGSTNVNSTSATAFDSLKAIYDPLFDLEMKAIEGDYNERAGKTIKFNKQSFDYDLAESARNIMLNLKAKSDAGDYMATSLLFTMTADTSWFEQLNTIFGGLTNIIGDLNPGKMISNLFKGKSLKSGAKLSGRQKSKLTSYKQNNNHYFQDLDFKL